MPAPKLALLGAGQGPAVDISNFRTPFLHVVQLPEGAFVLVHYDDGRKKEVFSNGHHSIEPGGFVTVQCVASSKHETICRFVSQAA